MSSTALGLQRSRPLPPHPQKLAGEGLGCLSEAWGEVRFCEASQAACVSLSRGERPFLRLGAWPSGSGSVCEGQQVRELGISMAHARWRGRRTCTPSWQGCVWNTGLEGCVCACTSDSSGDVWVSEEGSAWVRQHLHPKDARGLEGAAGVPVQSCARCVSGNGWGVCCGRGSLPVGRGQVSGWECGSTCISWETSVQVWCPRSTGHKWLPWEMHRALDTLRTELPAPYCVHIQRTWWGFLPPSSSGQAEWDPGNVHHEHSRPSQSQPGTDAQPRWEAAPTSMSARGEARGWTPKTWLWGGGRLPLGQLLPTSESCPCFAGLGLESRRVRHVAVEAGKGRSYTHRLGYR